jgi:probable lipoprotein NlpC
VIRVRHPGTLGLVGLLGAACASSRGSGHAAGGPDGELGARLVSRAEAALGQAGPFVVNGERFPADCSGYVASVYQAEGVPLRSLMVRAAPRESSGVAAAYQAARAFGVVFGGGGEWPRPGDLVFLHDTYDRNRNGSLDDPFTHVGIVEGVHGDGTVSFLHRGGRAVVRGALTLDRPGQASSQDGRELNSTLRDKRPRAPGAPVLAGQLFMGYGRIDPERIPGELAWR